MKKRRWLWVILFVWLALLLAILATSWNVVIVRDYHQWKEIARTFSLPEELRASPQTAVMGRMILGTLGFAAALGTILLFFLRLLGEMRLNQLQGEFLATVSHELKTPIAALELSSSLLRTGGVSAEESARLWESHQAELARLREDVEALLEAARMQVSQPLAVSTPIRLENWIEQSFERWKRILGPNAELLREGDVLEGEALLDLKTLNLVTDNLLDNARKFSREKPVVIIRTRELPPRGLFSRQPRWQVSIVDQGWGFDPSDSKRIFNRFFRGRTEAPYAIPGTGLGLYFAQSASRALGIELRGDSPGFGKGAVFTLEGPVKFS
ncbi:MAG: sensor histidine kinase [Bdellovibrionota bacterium]